MNEHPINPYVTKNLPVFAPDLSVKEAVEKLSVKQKRWGSLDYIFMTVGKKLKGFISIEELIAADRSASLEQVMQTEIASVVLGSDKERAVILAIRQNIYSVPVIDDEGSFVGVVEPHNLLKILHEENTEDFLTSAGVLLPKERIIDTLKYRTLQLVRLRLPWLILGLAGGMLATTIVSFFEGTLEKQLTLAFFIPIIVYMSDAVGTQTETLFIRSLSMRAVNMPKYLAKEIFVGLNIGAIIGILLFGFSYAWLRSLEIALIVSLAMFANISIAMVIATVIPYSLFKLKKDPALGSGPFATVIQDIVSLLIYFTVAVVILSLAK